METTVKQRLILYIKSKGLSQGKFEKIIGAGNGFVNNISKSIGAEKLQSILCNFPDLNANWLLYGDGEMLRNEQNVENNSKNNNGVNIQAGGNANNNQIGIDNDRMKDEIIALLKDKTALQNEIIAAKNRDIKELTEQCAHLLNELTSK